MVITTVKKLKIRTSEKFAVIILKVEQFGFMTVMRPKDANRITNSAVPDQTVPLGATLGLHCLPRPARPKT